MANATINLIIVLVIFLAVYSAIHIYVFFRMASLLDLERNYVFYVILAALALSFPALTIIERTWGNVVTGVLYTASSIWVGTLVFLFCSLLVYEVARLLIEINPKTAGFAILMVVFLLVIYSLLNAISIKVTHIEVPVKGLEKEMTVVQISDTHIGTNHNEVYLQHIVDKVNEINPEMVFITGDLVDGRGLLDEKSVAPLNNLKAKTFFTLGNHEQYEGVEKVMELLTTTKVQVLRDEAVEYKGVQIIGLDNREPFDMGESPLDTMNVSKKLPSILMFHPPQDLEKANAKGIDLQLSGHTHNGQIFPMNLIIRLFFFPRIHGLYEYRGTHLYVSSGAGTWGPPFRLGSRSEIVVIRLVKAQ